jgi:small-conductance mechanosensitive channel
MAGGISPSGRALRFVLWRAPLGAAKYTAAGYMATATEVGRRWIVMAGLGLWLWFCWRVAMASGVQGFFEVMSFLLLLWFWRLFVLVRWTIGLRVAAARARAQQRQMLKALDQLPGQLQQLARQAIPQTGGFTVPGMLRRDDPVRDEHERIARDQAAQTRRMVGDDLPIGDRFEPIWRLPRFMRRKLEEDDE